MITSANVWPHRANKYQLGLWDTIPLNVSGPCFRNSYHVDRFSQTPWTISGLRYERSGTEFHNSKYAGLSATYVDNAMLSFTLNATTQATTSLMDNDFSKSEINFSFHVVQIIVICRLSIFCTQYKFKTRNNRSSNMHDKSFFSLNIQCFFSDQLKRRPLLNFE